MAEQGPPQTLKTDYTQAGCMSGSDAVMNHPTFGNKTETTTTTTFIVNEGGTIYQYGNENEIDGPQKRIPNRDEEKSAAFAKFKSALRDEYKMAELPRANFMEEADLPLNEYYMDLKFDSESIKIENIFDQVNDVHPKRILIESQPL